MLFLCVFYYFIICNIVSYENPLKQYYKKKIFECYLTPPIKSTFV
jgi:hypothetical protein